MFSAVATANFAACSIKTTCDMVNRQTKVSDLTVDDLEAILCRVLLPGTRHYTDTLLDTRQASEFLGGISLAALYYGCTHNKIPHMRQGGRLYFSKDVLSQWQIENGFAQTTSLQTGSL